MLKRRKVILSGLGMIAGMKAIASYAQAASDQTSVPADWGSLGFGWTPDLPDLSDENLGSFPNFGTPLPDEIDLSSRFPAPYSQGPVGSCTANAIAGAVQYVRRANQRPNDFVPSRTYVYYYTRMLEGRVHTDTGGQLRNAINVVVNRGVVDERLWPYDDTAPDPVTRVFSRSSRHVTEPPASVRDEAEKFQTISHSRLSNNIDELRNVLATGYPFAFGFRVYSNFKGSTTFLREPDSSDQILPWGHAVLAVGYSNNKQCFRIRNSWGSRNHDSGYFDMAYSYVANPSLCRDFWVIYQTEGIVR